jgi:hypothetical protein
MTSRYRFATVLAILVSAFALPAQAAPLSAEAVDNATVQPAGPRGGSSGKAFLNIEGSTNGTFASYGVADFHFGVLPMPVVSVNSAQLALTQANAAFSTSGAVLFSVDQSGVLADIQPGGTSPLAFDGVDPGTGTDVGQGDLSLLALGGGPFSYVLGTTGDVDAYDFTLDLATQAELVSRLNSGATIRIVIGTGEAGVAATWAGATNSTWAGPTLNLDVTYDTGTPARSDSWGRIKALYR